ncbi:MotA/TolQ/ExbB proton channel family protein, probably associated with flagella [hydrothermal vent metagenome]|uniref:MotA/TolQ/ExbB proton channel family protein, probably associated with flagella n=1 Tax=hydrothermal vent metagenome TaxID=652676 RepID=A0A3B0TSM0_9ZZZZ
MATETTRLKMTNPQTFLWRMVLFVVIVTLLTIILAGYLTTAFAANPFLNGLILVVLLLGIVFAFMQVIRLYPEVKWVNNFRVGDPGLEVTRPPVLLAPMATMLSDQVGQVSLSTTSMRSLLDSIGTRLDEARDYLRYMVGLLVFLGLLGTFWGLLDTINSVGETISSLDVGSNESGIIFEELKAGLQAPLTGMGTAFSSSLFGLAGSLVLGFLDLIASQSQNRFYNDLEEWLSTVTELSQGEGAAGVNPAQLRFTMQDMQASIDGLTHQLREGGGGGKDDDALAELADGVQQLVRQMRQEQKLVREWAQVQADQQAEVTPILRELAKATRGGSSPFSPKKER